MNEFKTKNKKLGASLSSHLIGTPKEFGILTDNYETFIAKRSQAIADSLNEHLNPELE